MRATWFLTLAVTALAVCGDARTQKTRATKGQDRGGRCGQAGLAMDTRQFRNLKVPGKTVKANVRKLTTRLRWLKSLPAVKAAARRSHKPILWVQALGTLSGFA